MVCMLRALPFTLQLVILMPFCLTLDRKVIVFGEHVYSNEL